MNKNIGAHNWFSKKLPTIIVFLLIVPIGLLAQRWSFGVYSIGFILLWPLVIAQIIVANTGEYLDIKTILRSFIVTFLILAILVGLGIFLTPIMTS